MKSHLNIQGAFELGEPAHVKGRAVRWVCHWFPSNAPTPREDHEGS